MLGNAVSSIVTRGLYGGIPTLGLIPSYFSLYVPVVMPPHAGRAGRSSSSSWSRDDESPKYEIYNLPIDDKLQQLFNVKIIFKGEEHYSMPYNLTNPENVTVNNISINNKEIKFKIK